MFMESTREGDRVFREEPQYEKIFPAILKSISRKFTYIKDVSKQKVGLIFWLGTALTVAAIACCVLSKSNENSHAVVPYQMGGVLTPIAVSAAEGTLIGVICLILGLIFSCFSKQHVKAPSPAQTSPLTRF